MRNCINLGQAIVPVTISGHQRTFINCLPANDLELRFQGTIFCEMDDLDQTPPKQTLIPSWALEKQMVRAQFYVSQTTFGSLKFNKKIFFHKDLFVWNG